MTKHIEDDSEIVKDEDIQENNEIEEEKEDGTSEA